MKGVLSTRGSTIITNLFVSDGEMRETRQSRARRCRGWSMMTPGRLARVAIRGQGSNQHASWPSKSPWNGSCCSGPQEEVALERRGSVTEDMKLVVLGPS